LIDQDGNEKPVLRILIEEVTRAQVEEICVVVWPGDEDAYTGVAGELASRLSFVHQTEPLGYGRAIHCAKDFVGPDPFLHLVGDHLYVSRTERSCAQVLVEMAESEECSVSGVQITRENLLPHYGTVGGRRIQGRQDLYQVETVIEKPTPTVAEERLIVPGLRAGYYLCFFGMHVLSATVMEILEHKIESAEEGDRVTLSEALTELATREQYLALEATGWRYDVGVKYGLLTAQLALALSGS
ncbi:MAG: UTP--glucose-1-phosphate uridylyltransferase, partial [bacterium]|nr:UTP--glucose-1-phosphate uridylyltransferase [bacterium]